VKTFFKALMALLLFALLAAGALGFWGWTQAQAFLTTPANEVGEEVVLEIPRGSGPLTVGALLASNGVVSDSDKFAYFLRYRKAAPKLRAGEFRFRTDLTPDAVLDILVNATEVTYPITFPEGLRYLEMAPRVEEAGLGTAAEYIRLAEDAEFIASLGLPVDPPPENLEGMLLADTFSFPAGSTVEDVVRAQARGFSSLWNDDRRRKAKALGLSPYEVAVLASVVEKETGQADERPKIAGLFHNRLRIGMPLQSDPTIIYGLKNYDGNIRRSDIRRPHRWNTYVIPALPPTPIASAGSAAIDAVLNPESTKALYFVAKGRTGRHYFSTSLSEHNRAVDCYQRNRTSRCP
jgi:UPF0755 protein